MSFVSYAQNFEDVILWRVFREIERGSYVDIGAHDPVIDSVSLAFYNAGWRGIHVEPIASCAQRLREGRPDEIVIQAAVADIPGPMQFYELGGLSSGSKKVAQHHARHGHHAQQIVVPTVRLDSLLDQTMEDTHWLKIDVEGMELEVLRSWGESPKRPWALVIEATFPNTQEPTEDLWISEVLKRGYQKVFFDGLSSYFIHDSHRNLAPYFSAPANVFDEFLVTADHFSAADIRRDFAESEMLLQTSRASCERSNEELRLAFEVRDAERLERNRALERLAAAEQEHAASMQALATAAEVNAADARTELARLDERSLQLEDKLSRADRLADDAAARIRSLEEQLANLRAAQEEATERSRRDLDAAQTVATQAAEERERARDQVDHAWKQLEHTRHDLELQVDELRAKLELAHALILRNAVQKRGIWRWLRGAPDHAQLSTLQGLLDRSNLIEDNQQESPSNRQSPLRGVESIMQSAAPATARNPYLRANSLAELLAWDDIDFVTCAYVTVLGRRPDAEGEGYYVGRLRAGRSKMEVLWQIRSSPEASDHDPGIAGLDKAIRRERMLSWPSRSLRKLGGSSSRNPVAAGPVATADPVVAQVRADNEDAASNNRVDALAAEVESLKTMIESFGHALRGVANAQTRHQLQIDAASRSIASSQSPKQSSHPSK